MKKTLKAVSASPSKWVRTALSLAVVSLLIACGGGGGGGGGDAPPPPAPPPVSQPERPASQKTYAVGTISGFGSIVVNGVRYDESKASIQNEDGSAMKAADLKLGMTVDIVAEPAQKSSTGVMTATATQVQYRSELEGPLTAITGNQLKILGQTVLINEATVFEDGRPLSLQIGKVLDVHGQRNANGEILASRIEIENDLDDPYQLRAAISDLNGSEATFRIGEAIINYRTLRESVGPLANGEIVQLKLSRTPNASGQWLAEQLKKNAPMAALESLIASGAGVHADLEGYITRMDSATRFVVAGVVVDVSGVKNLPPLQVGRLIEVEGTLSQGILLASEVELENDLDYGKAFEIEGIISQIDPGKQTFEIRGVTVDYSNSRFEDGTVNHLRVGVEVEVEGTLSGDGRTIKAERIEFDD